jgi:hypothetical protein
MSNRPIKNECPLKIRVTMEAAEYSNEQHDGRKSGWETV